MSYKELYLSFDTDGNPFVDTLNGNLYVRKGVRRSINEQDLSRLEAMAKEVGGDFEEAVTHLVWLVRNSVVYDDYDLLFEVSRVCIEALCAD